MIRKVSKVDLKIVDHYLKVFHTTYEENEFRQCYLLELSNEIIGLIIYTILYERSELEYLYVDEKFRNKGYAFQLISWMITDCKKQFVKSITLEVNESNEGALALYRKACFKEIARRHHYYKDKDALVMERNLVVE